MDVGKHATTSDRHLIQELVELLVIPDRQLDVPGDDTGLLVVASSIASQLKHFSCEILKHSRQINRCTSTDTITELAFLHEAGDTTHRELKSCLRRLRDSLGASLLSTTTFAFSISTFACH